jgi:hypothetical protein
MSVALSYKKRVEATYVSASFNVTYQGEGNEGKGAGEQGCEGASP